MGFSLLPLQINIDGEAGTNKLYFITILSTILYNIAIATSKPSPLA